MNEFQLQCIPTRELEILRSQIAVELARRAQPKMVEARLQKIERIKLQAPGAITLLNKDVTHKNSLRPLYPPNYRKRTFGGNSPYFQSLMAQDWSHLFSGFDPSPNYYVYAHVDPKGRIPPTSPVVNFYGTPFYIGKGSGNRAFNLRRNQGHGKMISSVLAAGFEPANIVQILFDGLSERKAFEIESKLIFFFGTLYQLDRKHGCLYNLDTPSIPNFDGPMEEYFEKPSYRQARSKNGELKNVQTKGRRMLPVEVAFSKGSI